MARPKAKELTERELEIMHAFWAKGDLTVADVREHLGNEGRDLAYTTVATLIRILTEKGFLETANNERPFVFRPVRSFEDVSKNLLGDVIQRVFQGSREGLLVRVLGMKKLTKRERSVLEDLLREQSQ